MNLQAESYQNLRANVATAPISGLLQTLVLLADDMGNREVGRWARLELGGYISDNPLMTDDVEVPKYRTVAGLWKDAYDRPLLLRDPKLSFVNAYRLRNGVAELERLALSHRPHVLADDSHAAIIRESLRVDVRYFVFGSHDVDGILSNIRTQLVGVLGELKPPSNSSIRLRSSSPASNMVDIARLIGAAEVKAVFDPYLDNNACTSLLDLLSLGVAVSNNLRLLAAEKMTTGPRPRLTKTFVDGWFKQHDVAGQVRLMPNNEHRRFLLLSGGRSLILGMSLNGMDKNEAAYLDDDTEDRSFFEGVWATARPL